MTMRHAMKSQTPLQQRRMAKQRWQRYGYGELAELAVRLAHDGDCR